MSKVTLAFSVDEAAILAELRARLRLDTDADLIRVALWMYARGQGLVVPPALFAVTGVSKRSTRNTC